MDQRFKALQQWLVKDLGWDLDDLSAASKDASFRRYFRATLAPATEQSSFVVMDAPPQQEKLEPFVSIAQILRKLGVNSPQIYELNEQLGFLVLQDLGDITYLQSLNDKRDIQHADTLYNAALASLIKIQQGTWQEPSFKLPAYNSALLEQELDLFTNWYLAEHLQITLDTKQLNTWQHTQQLLIAACEEQPQVWVHRDFHSRNLMLTTENSPGVIDFQDMVIGPISYDLASLFKDCYIQWPRETQLRWLNDYYQLIKKANFKNLEFSFEQLIKWYDLTGIQRHLKVLGIFCRLNYRDGKNQYINDLPLVKLYIEDTLALYPELSNFLTLFNQLHD